MNKRNITVWGVILSTLLALTSCKNATTEEVDPMGTYMQKARTLLSGDIVLGTKATLGGDDKTLLESGCPTLFNFTWKDDQHMLLTLPDFQVGAMPFSVVFKCNTRFLTLNEWEKKEYQGSGWIKFEGRDGAVGLMTTEGLPDDRKGSGAKVDGYLNVETEEIVFVVDYNLMSVKSNTFRQKIDKSRLANFEKEKAAYEKALAEEKERRGL